MWDLLQSWPVMAAGSALLSLAAGAWYRRRKMEAFFAEAGLSEGDTISRDTPDGSYDPGRIVHARGNHMAVLMYYPTTDHEPKLRVMHSKRTTFLEGGNGFISTHSLTDPEDRAELRALGVSDNEIRDIVTRVRVKVAA